MPFIKILFYKQLFFRGSIDRDTIKILYDPVNFIIVVEMQICVHPLHHMFTRFVFCRRKVPAQ